MNPIEEALAEYWGNRCPDFDPTCPICTAWAAFDKLKRPVIEAANVMDMARLIDVEMVMCAIANDDASDDWVEGFDFAWQRVRSLFREEDEALH